MNKNKILIIALLALVLMVVMPVSAETIAGNLSAPPGYTSSQYGSIGTANTYSAQQWRFVVVNAELTGDSVSLIHFDYPGTKATFDSGAPNYAITPMNLTYGTRVVAEGEYGYYRLFDSAWPIPNEITGYQFWLFNSWNITGLSGTIYLNWSYNKNAVYNCSYFQRDDINNPPASYLVVEGYNPTYWFTLQGNWTWNKDVVFYNHYNATKPSGLGITGYVEKRQPGGAFYYNSRAYIVDGITNTPICSESIVSDDLYFFNVPAATIKICLLSSGGIWYNTSTLFTTTTPEITGSYNITFHVVTYQGVNVYNAKVVFASKPVVGKTIEEVAVTGYTNASGMVTFYNQTAGAAAIVQVTATGYKDYVSTFTFTSDMLKEIQMSPPSVDLYVNVRDSSTGHYMEDFQVGIQNTTSGIWRNSTQETGSLYFDSTGANYEYPLSLNETVILAASKAGYKPNWKSVTIPYDMYTTTLYLINLNATAPSSGNFTAVIAVSDQKTGTGIQGASVNIQGLGRAGTTTTAGAVTFRNIAAGSYTLSVSAPGYQSRISDLTGTDGDTVLKSIQLLPEGCSISESGTMICDGSIVVPGMTPATNQTANEKAAGGVTAFLDNIVGIGYLILLGIVFWFGKKIFFS